jgi:uncharacterized membrane protein
MSDANGEESDLEDAPRMADLYDDLRELEETVDSSEEREQVRETIRTALEVRNQPGVFGRIVKGFGLDDAAQALLGALLFGIPMFVEGGTTEIGAYLATRPVHLVGTHAAVLGLIIGILYVADIQDVRIQNPIFGIVPRRLVGVLTISFLTALVVMVGWGVTDPAVPIRAFADATVAYVPMSIGAALGDIIPG